MKLCELPLRPILEARGIPEEKIKLPRATMTSAPGHKKYVFNLPEEKIEGASTEELLEEVKAGTLTPVKGVKIIGGSQISGPHIELVKNTDGKIGVFRVAEGLWEDRRGVKVDGGERRKADVRAKRRSAERKAAA